MNIPQGPCRVVSNPEREGFVRPAQAAFSSTVSRRRRASACSDASASFEPCRQVVDVLETTGRQLSSWHKHSRLLLASRCYSVVPNILLVPPISRHCSLLFLSFDAQVLCTRASLVRRPQRFSRKRTDERQSMAKGEETSETVAAARFREPRSIGFPMRRKRPGFCLIRSVSPHARPMPLDHRPYGCLTSALMATHVSFSSDTVAALLFFHVPPIFTEHSCERRRRMPLCARVCVPFVCRV